MKQFFLNLYRRFDRIQNQTWFLIVASVLALATCGAVFGSLLATSYSLAEQRETLFAALDGKSLRESDQIALSLRDHAEINVDGTTYRLNQFAHETDRLFDRAGNFVSVPLVIEDMLTDQIPQWAPAWLLDQPQTTWLLGIVATAWLLLIIWMGITLPFLMTLIGTLIPVSILWYYALDQFALAVAGMGLLVFTFVLLSRALLFCYSYPNQILAVAHTVIKEASRSRISLVFIVLLLLTLPLIPLWLDPEAPLRYRIQTFISRSITLTFVLAASMTVFLSCASVAFEIRDRQIWHLMTKPLSRLNYLLGKWLGVVSVNLVLLLVAGVSIFTFVQYLRTTPVASGVEGQLDALQVNNEVLTARIAITPEYHRLEPDQLRERRQQRIDRDPELAGTEVPLAKQREIDDEIQRQHLAWQRNIQPRQPGQEPHHRSYLFTGLERAREIGAPLQLRYRFWILESDQHETFPAGFIFNNDPNTQRQVTYVPSMVHVTEIPADYIREDGTLLVSIFNLYEVVPGQQGSGAINFDTNDLELLYKAGNFEGNFLRAMLVTWTKLAFLAILGIACSTFLSFAVACLLSFTIFIAGSIAPFLAIALLEYQPPLTAHVDWSNLAVVIRWAFMSFIQAVAQGLVFALGAFGKIKPSQDLVEGKLIHWRDVLLGVFWIGLIWSSAALIIGYLVMRSRQLAIYSGQG